MNKLILFAVCMLSYARLFAQCNITSEINPNGTMSKTAKPEVIYFNEKATMFCSIKYDGVDFYFDWIIKPFDKTKVKSESMNIILDNDSAITLEFYDSYSVAKDTSINLLYQISKENMELLRQSGIHQIRMMIDEKEKVYILILHKDLLKGQLECILDSEKKVKKKEEEK